MKISIKKLNDFSVEQKNIAKEIFKIQGVNNATICGRYLLYELLDGHVDDIIFNKNGKPLFKNNNQFFNISHSGEYVVCVISDYPVGVDIQLIGDIPKLDILFNDEEKKLSNNELVCLWTKKEAIIKAEGLALKNFKKIDINFYDVYTERIDDYIMAVCELKKQ